MTVLVVIVLVCVFKNELKTLMEKIATIKFLGGELSTIPQGIDHTGETGPEEPLWEYLYLKDYLVLNTHWVLAWLNQNSTSIDLFNAYWWFVIPLAKSRENTILALQNHYLITVRDEGMIEITDKGREYLQWRGPLPEIPRPKSS